MLLWLYVYILIRELNPTYFSQCAVVQWCSVFSIMTLLAYFQMAKELDGIIDSSEAEFAKSCITSDGSTSYMEKIITPIYESMAAVGSFIEGSILMYLS